MWVPSYKELVPGRSASMSADISVQRYLLLLLKDTAGQKAIHTTHLRSQDRPQYPGAKLSPHSWISLYSVHLTFDIQTGHVFFDASNCQVHDYLWRQASIPEQAQWAWSKGDVRGPEIFRNPQNRIMHLIYIYKTDLGFMPQLMFWFLQSIHCFFQNYTSNTNIVQYLSTVVRICSVMLICFIGLVANKKMYPYVFVHSYCCFALFSVEQISGKGCHICALSSSISLGTVWPCHRNDHGMIRSLRRLRTGKKNYYSVYGPWRV